MVEVRAENEPVVVSAGAPVFLYWARVHQNGPLPTASGCVDPNFDGTERFVPLLLSHEGGSPNQYTKAYHVGDGWWAEEDDHASPKEHETFRLYVMVPDLSGG